MIHDIIGLPSFSVLGLEQVGPAATAFEWVPPLWAQVMARTPELGLPGGSGCWGLMSGMDKFLAPWGQQGRYLAGWQVPRGTEPRGDWQVWNVPASSWLRVWLRLDQYGEALDFTLREFLPASPWIQDGAIHEHYPVGFLDPKLDSLLLCVPIAPRS